MLRSVGRVLGLEHLSGMFRGSEPCSSFSSPFPDHLSLEAGVGLK